jgi:N-acetyl-1-D-myo-inositol-2-amino-2-deoxy-alpha-D-glucopyranoside deacetylase
VTTTPQDDRESLAAAEHSVLEAAEDVVEDVTEHELDAADVVAMDHLDAPRRLLLVHAHPDDESILNGATMASYAAAGVHVTLVTCTRGERGEVIPADLKHLEGHGDALAERRAAELATAMEALGVGDHRFLGAEAGVRFRDSGMAWGPGGRAVAAPDVDDGAFAMADADSAARHLVRVLREIRPQVVVTYEPGGGYGHPDHVQAHRVAVRAVELAAAPDGHGEPWEVAKVYESVVPHSAARAALRESTAANPFTPMDPDRLLPSLVVPDDEVTTVVEAHDHVEAKAAALRAHATQVEVAGGFFALSHGIGQPLVGVEYYRLARGVPVPDPGRDDGRESDLFAGVAH